MNFIDARLKNFVEARLNHDTLCNFVFWMGMTCWVYFSLPTHPMLALSSFVGMPFLIKKLFPLKVVEVRPELVLDFPDSKALAANSAEKAEKEDVPTSRECLANSEGKIVSDGAPYLFLVLLATLAIDFINIAFIKPPAVLNTIEGLLLFSTLFLIPVSIFILYNRPISLLFDSRAWYLQGWRAVRSSESRYFSYSYRHLSCNRYYHR